MASILNRAKILLNPAGSTIAYKEDKIYSVLPTNGDVDFSFSGGDGGTRVNQEGYIEVTPANLTTNSENLSSGWTFNNSSIVSTNNTSPTNTSNATLITEGTSNTYHRYYSPLLTGVSSGGTYTVSQYVKYHSCQYISLGLGDSSTFRGYMVFDVQNGIIVDSAGQSGGTLNDAGFQNVGGGWYRIWITVTASSWAGSLISNVIGFQNSSTYSPFGSYTGTDRKIYGWGAQTNNGYVRPYQPTTDRLNYPRINFQDGAGALLTEDQRTNLVPYSTNFSQWSQYNAPTLTSGSILGPDNASYATTISASDGSNFKGVTINPAIVANATYGFSVFVKKLDNILDKYPGGTATVNNVRGGIGLVFNGGTQKVVYVSIDESIGGYNIMTDQNGNTQVRVEEYKDYYRYLIGTQDTGTNTNVSVTLYAILSTNSGVSTGNGVGETTYWGAHLEQMVSTGYEVVPSSYIPTNGATVTRTEDLFSTSNISSVITDKPITWYAHMRSTTTAPNGYGFRVFHSSGNGWLGMYRNTTGAYNDGSGPQYPNLGTYQNNTPLKMVARVGSGVVKYFINGVQKFNGAFTDPTGEWASFENDNINQSRNYRTFAIFNEALSDADCIELSTVNSASGGDYYIDGVYTIHKFDGSGTFTPSFTGQVEVLIVAGGGGGGNDNAGGGGAGGVVYSSGIGVSAGTGYSIVVGAGGTGRSVNEHGLNGGDSSAFGITAYGGGGGGAGDAGGGQTPPVADLPGRDGGSGGGGASESGNGPGGSGIPGQGNDGDQGLNGSGGGGGGASSAGTAATTNARPGNGGDGLLYSISGYPRYYGGGGGGSTENAVVVDSGYGLGGLGGGGNGGYGATATDTMAQEGNTNTGGGGGGQPYPNTPRDGANGGSGIVIIRYLT